METHNPEERMIFDASKQLESESLKKQSLEEYHFVKLLPGEKVLAVQRQHWLVYALPMLFSIVTTIIIFVGFFLATSIIRPLITFDSTATGIYLLLTLIVMVLVFGTYTFINWYYQFYIVTNKCLLHIHFFRMGGSHFDEVFLEKSPMQGIERHASNGIYDLLGIEDVYVYFNRNQRPEPFVFKTIPNARKIQELVEMGEA